MTLEHMCKETGGYEIVMSIGQVIVCNLREVKTLTGCSASILLLRQGNTCCMFSSG